MMWVWSYPNGMEVNPFTKVMKSQDEIKWIEVIEYSFPESDSFVGPHFYTLVVSSCVYLHFIRGVSKIKNKG